MHTEPLEGRRATPSDAVAIAALFTLPHARDFVHAMSVDDVTALAGRDDRELWVFERGREVVATLLLGNGSGGWLWEILAIVVRDPHEGVGTRVMHYAIARAFGAGAHRIFLEVLEKNIGARALYERLGFTAEGCYRDGYRGDDGTFENLIPYGMLASSPILG